MDVDVDVDVSGCSHFAHLSAIQWLTVVYAPLALSRSKRSLDWKSKGIACRLPVMLYSRAKYMIDTTL